MLFRIKKGKKMKVSGINFISLQHTNLCTLQQHEKVDRNNVSNNYATNGLEHLAALNKPIFTGKRYELGLSHEELVKRTSKEYLSTITLLSPESPEYLNLAEGDKKALKHLVKAADVLGVIGKQIDDKDNIPFEKYLDKEIKKGNIDAILTKKLYDGMDGVAGKDRMNSNVSLIKGKTRPMGMGVYPSDLSVDEFHQILINMLKKGKVKEVSQILNQRTVVERDGKELKAVDYVDKFHKEFKIAADELEKAAKYSTNKDFNEYLKLQAKALRKADPMLDAYADKKWAELQDTPLEFSIPRENYDDEMTSSVLENKELMALLNVYDITPIPKDTLGGRVGIINKEGTEALLGIKRYLPTLAKRMPYSNEYKQQITDDAKQTRVDVDLVALTGDVKAYRGGITLAENLPNEDKLSLTIGGGKRNVYHRQVREDMTYGIKSIIDDSQKFALQSKYDHMWTIGHENAHSLGPKEYDKLGKYKNIVEENKADIAAMTFVDYLTDVGYYSEEDRKAILINWAAANFLKAKPVDMSFAHRVRTVMQCKYMMDNGVYEFSPDGKLHINEERVVPAAKKMLNEIIRIQIDNDYKKAEEYVNKYFVWTPEMEYVSQVIQENAKSLNGTVKSPLADYILGKK